MRGRARRAAGCHSSVLQSAVRVGASGVDTVVVRRGTCCAVCVVPPPSTSGVRRPSPDEALVQGHSPLDCKYPCELWTISHPKKVLPRAMRAVATMGPRHPNQHWRPVQRGMPEALRSFSRRRRSSAQRVRECAVRSRPNARRCYSRELVRLTRGRSVAARPGVFQRLIKQGRSPPGQRHLAYSQRESARRSTYTPAG